MLGGLGDVLSAANRTAASFGGRQRNGDGGGVAGPPEGWGLVGRKRWSGRISWVLRVAVGSTVATANGVGDDELRSGACRERAENGTGSRGREGGLDGSGRLRGVSTHG